MLRSSVSCWISWHSEIYGAVWWPTQNKSELSKDSSSILTQCYFLLRYFISHEYRKTKTKGTVGNSFPFDDFPPENVGSSVSDEEEIDNLRYLYGNYDCMLFQYKHRHVRRCVHTLGRVRTRHDINASVISVHECYVDIFILQVSNNSGCNKCSVKMW